MIIPDFKYLKQCSQGREERLQFIINEVKKSPDYHFDGAAWTNERCSDLTSINYIIDYCTRMMHYAPQTRKDLNEQILMELKII